MLKGPFLSKDFIGANPNYEESKIGMYDYVLKNDNLEKAVNIIEEIIRQEMKTENK